MTTPTTDKAAVTAIIRALTGAGYELTHVWDGEEDVPATTEKAALDAIFAVNSAYLFVKHPKTGTSSVWFVLGNEPFEVAADYTVDLEHVLGPLTESWD